MVGQVDDTDFPVGHLRVGSVAPSGEVDPRPVRHRLRSVCPHQLHIICSHCAFGVLERRSAARVESKVGGLYLFSPLNGRAKPCVEAAAVAAVIAGRSGT